MHQTLAYARSGLIDQRRENKYPSVSENQHEEKTKKNRWLEKKPHASKAQIQILEAGEKSRERKRDARCKLLIGTYFLDKAKASHSKNHPSSGIPA